MTTLALKYRPRSLDDVSGQPHVTVVLNQMIKRYRAGEIELPAGIILTGPKGSGKTSTARIIAANLNCSFWKQPCELGDRKCTCQSIQSQASDSVIEVDGATSGRVDDVRQLKTMAKLQHSGLYRVIIIDEAHANSAEAWSALLKQLEEPPPNVLYILVTTEFHKIPATIATRCFVFSYTAISEEFIASRLRFVCTAENVPFEDACLVKIARKSKGAMRDALMTLEQLFILQDVSVARFDSLWPSGLETFAFQLLQYAKLGSLAEGDALIQATFARFRDVGLLIDAILDCIRAQLVLAVSADQSVLPPRTLSDFAVMAWELRVKLRSLSVTDPTLLYTLFILYCRELGGRHGSTYTSLSTYSAPAPFSSVPVSPAYPTTNGSVPSDSESEIDLLKSLSE